MRGLNSTCHHRAVAVLVLALLLIGLLGRSQLSSAGGELQAAIVNKISMSNQQLDVETANNGGPPITVEGAVDVSQSIAQDGAVSETTEMPNGTDLATPTQTILVAKTNTETPTPNVPTFSPTVPTNNVPVPTNTAVVMSTQIPRATATAVSRPGGLIVRNPIVSRGKPTFTNAGSGDAVVDGVYGGSSWWPGFPSLGNPVWLAIKVGNGPSRLLLNWTSTGNYNYTDTTYGALGDYLIQTSSDSTNGADGTWTTVVTVSQNNVKQREHSFDFSGKSWVRLVVMTAAANVASYGIQIDEIDMHDISQGAQDVWFFLGDSITAGAFDRRSSHQPSFAAGIAAAHPGYYPAMINGGIGYETSGSGANRIDGILQSNPDIKFVAIEYGGNDAAGNNSNTSSFQRNMQTIIDKVKAAGRTPVLARITYVADGNHNNIPAFNAVVDNLTQANGLKPGPDLYTWFQSHQNELSGDRIHPNDAGYASINRLWSEAMSSFYQ